MQWSENLKISDAQAREPHVRHFLKENLTKCELLTNFTFLFPS